MVASRQVKRGRARLDKPLGRRRGGFGALAGSVLALAVASPPAQGEVVVDGRGYGHGVGMAQYGALGQARDGRDFRSILGHYYRGTRTQPAARTRMRVRLKATRAARVTHAARVRAVDGRRLDLIPGRTYRIVPWQSTGLRMIDMGTGRTRAHLHGPVRLTGRTPLALGGRAENGVTDGRYRGALVLSRLGARVLVVGDLDLEHYLYGVVPGEMPAGWPAEALKAQAVAARSYAWTSRRPGAAFDVFADTRSQVYRGVGAETRATTAAVQATRRLAVMAGGTVARTLFHSSSGGRTAGIEEVFGGPPVSFLRAVPDPYDSASPHHRWTVRLSDAEAERRLAPVLHGRLVSIAVAGRTSGGRASIVRVTGTQGVSDVAGPTVRTLLGLKSSWFTITHRAAPARR